MGRGSVLEGGLLIVLPGAEGHRPVPVPASRKHECIDIDLSEVLSAFVAYKRSAALPAVPAKNLAEIRPDDLRGLKRLVAEGALRYGKSILILPRLSPVSALFSQNPPQRS